tara:strand:+ start:2543 stop:3565 length:1023 start_codon:yes stop_codon:yes gene_type:complete
MKLSATDIAGIVNGVVDGDKKSIITKLSKIENGDKNSLSFLGNPKYSEYLYSSNASIIIVNKNFELKKKINSTLIRVQDPNIAFSKLLEYFESKNEIEVGISKTAEINKTSQISSSAYIGSYTVIKANVKISNNTNIGSNVSIGKNVKIGRNCKIFSNVSIYNDSVIGNNCIIHSGTVIGSDGFGFNKDKNGKNLKVIHFGNVIIEDNVEIGSNCSIDRATLGSTKIMNGVKIDNLVQIAHNVVVGENTCIAAQVGIAGSSVVGSDCLIGGQAGIAGHLKIGDRVQIQAKTGVLKNLDSDSKVMGFPAINYMDYNKSYVYFKNFPKIMRVIDKLIKKKND